MRCTWLECTLLWTAGAGLDKSRGAPGAWAAGHGWEAGRSYQKKTIEAATDWFFEAERFLVLAWRHDATHRACMHLGFETDSTKSDRNICPESWQNLVAELRQETGTRLLRTVHNRIRLSDWLPESFTKCVSWAFAFVPMKVSRTGRQFRNCSLPASGRLYTLLLSCAGLDVLGGTSLSFVAFTLDLEGMTP